MDRKELKQLLEPFQALCAQRGRKITEICIEEAYPGDVSTSYIIQVKATWVDDMSCYEALDFLFDILWETTTEETRRKVFSIQVIDSKNTLHCEEITAPVITAGEEIKKGSQ